MVSKVFDNIEYAFLSFCMIATTLLLFTNVILRYFFQSAIFWAEEALRYLIVWITFIGAATCVKEGAHISLDTILTIMPGKAKYWFGIISNLICLIFSFILFKFSLSFVWQVKTAQQVSSTIGGLPMYIVYSCMPVGLFLIAVRSCQLLLRQYVTKSGNSTGKEV